MKTRIKQLLREKSAREGRNVTQKELAEFVGVQQVVISKYANGKITRPHMPHLFKMCEFFGVTLNDLVVTDEGVAEGNQNRRHVAPVEAIPA